MSNCSYLKY